MPSATVLLTVVASVVVAVVVVALLRRPRRDGPTGPSLPSPPGGEGRTSKVRVLPSDENARQAREEALRAEIASLRREAAYAEQRGLERRAQRLRAMIADRSRQLPSRGAD